MPLIAHACPICHLAELIPHLEKDPAFQQRGLFGGRVTQTAAIRVALSLGLDALRERYGLAEGQDSD